MTEANVVKCDTNKDSDRKVEKRSQFKVCQQVNKSDRELLDMGRGGFVWN